MRLSILLAITALAVVSAALIHDLAPDEDGSPPGPHGRDLDPGAEDYWTPERLRDATPMENDVEGPRDADVTPVRPGAGTVDRPPNPPDGDVVPDEGSFLVPPEEDGEPTPR